jgi:hypothetical protein
MQKERIGSFVHMLGFSVIVAMIYATVISMIVELTVLTVNMFPKIINVSLRDGGFLNMMLLDLLDAKAFSIMFTAVFIVTSFLKTSQLLNYRLEGWKSSLCMAIVYITLFFMYFALNKTIFVSKTTIFIIALLIVLLVELSRNGKKDIVLWTTMEKAPKYYNANLFSVVTLVIVIVAIFVLISLSTFVINKFLCFICDVLIFPYISSILKIAITKILDSLRYFFMLVSWAYMGNIHDGIIASQFEERGTRY